MKFNWVVSLFIIIYFFTACKEKTAYPIAQANTDSTFTLNNDISKVKNYFKFVAQNAKKNVDLTDFKIVTKKDLGNQESYHLLEATSRDKIIKMAIVLFMEEGMLSVTSASLKLHTIICECDCESGLNIERNNGVLKCANNCKSECVETRTVAYEENNYTTPIQAFLDRY